MRAQVLETFDGPDGLHLRTLPEPELGRPDDVRLAVEACGVCHRDITWACLLYTSPSPRD